jgi:hypothetical protein
VDVHKLHRADKPAAHVRQPIRQRPLRIGTIEDYQPIEVLGVLQRN